MAESGWLISWAMEAASSPTVMTRVTCANSACDLRKVSSARIRSSADLRTLYMRRLMTSAVVRKASGATTSSGSLIARWKSGAVKK
jgi:hypothetical protein